MTAPNPSSRVSPAGGQDVVNSDATAVGPGATEHAQGSGLPASDASQSPAGGPPASADSGWGYFHPDLKISTQDRPAYDHLAQTMREQGVPTERGSQLISWMTELDATPTPTEQVAHKFDTERFQWSEEDRPYVTAYLNRAYSAGWSQQDVEHAIRWYKTAIEPSILGQRAGEANEAAAKDAADAKAGTRALKIEWGDEAASNFRVLNGYVNNLPAAEREALKQKELPDGRLALNDPDFVKGLLKKARDANGMTLEQIREVMRTDRRRYTRDEAMQNRYRALLRGEA